MDSLPRIPARGGSTRIRRFDGLCRRTSNWDGLRKDNHLWFWGADCQVHFHSYGASQRGASLRIPFASVKKLECNYLTQKCLHTHKRLGTIPSDDGHGDNKRAGARGGSPKEDSTYELYVPAPSDLTKEQAFQYHLTTRNFLAYAVGKPVVGEKLSTALIDLWKRLRQWRAASSPADFTGYMQKQGYLSFVENSEHALACLKFAEEARFKDIWIDAFVHCVGMRERLDLSPEFAGISNTTIALITRASLEMDLHIGRITRAIGFFLEEELGPDNLGLTKLARDHLDHFRSFLHAFYVDKLGWFPPRQGKKWDKRPWFGMYDDFQQLYEYLVDNESTDDWTSGRGLTGGICVIQNVRAFDQRHGYEPLGHPLPLLPQPPSIRRRSLSSQRALRSFKLGRTNSIPEPNLTPGQSLSIATNCLKVELMGCPLVQEYQRFERHQTNPKLDVAEGRKVRWLLIYGILQMLTSILRAPKEVKDSDTAQYPMCVLTTGCPTWFEYAESIEESDAESDASSPTKQTLEVRQTLDALERRSPSRISIHPDCEADNAEDFFAANSISRQSSFVSINNASSPITRTASIRSSVQAIHKSVVGGLSRRNSIRRNSLRLEPRKVRSLVEMVIEHEGIVVEDAHEEEEEGDSRPQTAFHSAAAPELGFKNPLQEFDFGLGAINGEPTLETSQLNPRSYDGSLVLEHDEDNVDRSPCESNFSGTSGEFPPSSRTSYAEDDFPETEMSSWDGDIGKRESDHSLSSLCAELMDDLQEVSLEERIKRAVLPTPRTAAAKIAYSNVNAGCYIPTGMIAVPKSKFMSRSMSAESLMSAMSAASSLYPDEALQAADIEEEEETRGRRRSRAQDRLSQFVVNGTDFMRAGKGTGRHIRL